MHFNKIIGDICNSVNKCENGTPYTCVCSNATSITKAMSTMPNNTTISVTLTDARIMALLFFGIRTSVAFHFSGEIFDRPVIVEPFLVFNMRTVRVRVACVGSI